MTSAVDLPAIAAADERRRERVRILRACRPLERRFLKALPEHRYEPYSAALNMVPALSTRTVWNLLKRPRVRRAMDLFLQDALDQIGVSHASLVADLVEIKRRCMQASPVLDNKGMPTGEYQFDSRGAIAAIKEVAELLKLVPAKHVVFHKGGELPAPVFHISFEDGGPGDYGIEVSGKIGHHVPGSDAVN